MALKKYKPITAGTRWRIGNAYAEVTTNTPEKSLLETVKKTGGRNAQGRRSMRYIGGGHKQMYRKIDFKRILANKNLSGMQYYFVEQDACFNETPLEAIVISHKGLASIGFK